MQGSGTQYDALSEEGEGSPPPQGSSCAVERVTTRGIVTEQESVSVAGQRVVDRGAAEGTGPGQRHPFSPVASQGLVAALLVVGVAVFWVASTELALSGVTADGNHKVRILLPDSPPFTLAVHAAAASELLQAYETLHPRDIDSRSPLYE